MFAPADVFAATGHLYVFHGSNAPYANATAFGSACHQCHTHEGFVEYAETGANATTVDETPAPPGCFSCHAPHEDGNFGLRTTAAVTLVDNSTFDIGSGNLCVTCHLSRTSSDVGINGTVSRPVSYTVKFGANPPTALFSSHWGPHHGPQGDYLTGVNNWDSGQTYDSTDPHASGDSCVTCHHYQPDERMSGNLEWGGHGFYLTAEVHGAAKDLIANCTACHSSNDFYNSADDPETEAFLYMDKAAADWDGSGGPAQRVFEEIQGLRNTLIDYFADGTNFVHVVLNTPVPDPTDEDTWTYTYSAGVAGDGPLVDATDVGTPDVDTGRADPVLGTNGYEWGQSYEFAEAEMTQTQAESFWNLRYFIEDKSGGIHNPTFAAQMLYDAANNLGLTVGTRP
jgi:hypothetical protein